VRGFCFYSLTGIGFQRNLKIILESRKVFLYLCGMTKTIKIPKPVHKELKLFVANKDNENMEDVAGFAIMDYLKSQGHKFSVKLKQPSSKTKK
jgi:hypothetical protein